MRHVGYSNCFFLSDLPNYPHTVWQRPSCWSRRVWQTISYKTSLFYRWIQNLPDYTYKVKHYSTVTTGFCFAAFTGLKVYICAIKKNNFSLFMNWFKLYCPFNSLYRFEIYWSWFSKGKRVVVGVGSRFLEIRRGDHSLASQFYKFFNTSLV